uniref:Ras-associating domain-containing protein n=1 Tax=Timema shepardi TaxID=629360 RepID=A0A7R9B1Y4_TIMSH|nr:unnamed protein product [Timema shepardi]
MNVKLKLEYYCCEVSVSPKRNRAPKIYFDALPRDQTLVLDKWFAPFICATAVPCWYQKSLQNTTIKVYAKCLRPDIEYKTLSITFQTSCREVVTSLLNKYRMRHRDPNLFYLTMEVTVRKAEPKTVYLEFPGSIPGRNRGIIVSYTYGAWYSIPLRKWKDTYDTVMAAVAYPPLHTLKHSSLAHHNSLNNQCILLLPIINFPCLFNRFIMFLNNHRPPLHSTFNLLCFLLMMFLNNHRPPLQSTFNLLCFLLMMFLNSHRPPLQSTFNFLCFLMMFLNSHRPPLQSTFNFLCFLNSHRPPLQSTFNILCFLMMFLNSHRPLHSTIVVDQILKQLYNLFFFPPGVRTVLVLDEEARPAALQSCHPRGDSRFSLQTRRGGLVKIYDSILMPARCNITPLFYIFQSQYKSLLISDRTTVDELIQILLSCYNSKEQVEQFSLYEVCKSQEYQRKLHPDDCPLQVQQCWGSPSEFHFLIRRNLDFRPCRKTRKLLGPWTPELPTIPCSSRQNQPAPIQSSLVSDSLAKQRSSSSYTDYENYFYI